tara:strand:- start:1158 stop:4016 length:2859 start_codon:yes stop_codon:yes gene_type:complete
MTIDSALNELFPIHQIGSDGFRWWIGQVETTEDPKKSGRCKVRIVGIHPKDCFSVTTDDLPWAISTFPVTTPHVAGTATTVSNQLNKGVWVIGFFLDNDQQHPCIIGSIGGTAHSTDKELSSEDPTKECLGFETYLPDYTLVADLASEEGGKLVKQKNTDAGHCTTGTCDENTDDTDEKIEYKTNLQEAQDQDNSDVNPAGTKICVVRAGTCDTDLKSTFTRLFSEMLYEVQRNNGKLGTYLVGEMSGGIYDQIDIGREYVDKAILVMKTFIANIKGFVLEKIREAVKWITKSIIKPTIDGSGLNKAQDFLDTQLAKVGCTMADLGDRLAKWLEDIIFGYLFNIYKETACQIDEFVQGLLNKIQSLMNDILEKILGPLQDILGAIAAPLNMIGEAINKVLNLLGIQCNGPNEKCTPKTKICSDNSDDDPDKDFLDRLLEDLDKWGTGQDWAQYTCTDVYEGKKLIDTGIAFVGGVQEEETRIKYLMKDITVKEGEIAVFTVERSGFIGVASSVEFNVIDGSATKVFDFADVSGVLGFAPNEKSKTIEVETYQDNVDEFKEDFFMRIVPDTPSDGSDYSSFFFNNIARCVITPIVQAVDLGGQGDDGDIETGELETGNNDFPNVNVNDPKNWVDIVEPDTTGEAENNLSPKFIITPDKTTVKEGEFVTFTIVATNVIAGTPYDYSLVGSGITPSDFISNTMRGTFIVEDFGDYSAKVVIGIKVDADLTEQDETLIFGIPGTGSTASVIISSDLTGLSDEDRNKIQDLGENDTGDLVLKLPEAGDVITNDDGGVLEIPIKDSGTRFVERPAVFITGQGYGATGEVLLDNDGFAKEIRIIDPGFGYKKNTPTTANKECIIDSFTMISPGTGYTSVPTVFVNKSKDIAEAQINSDGQVIAIRIKDRTVTFQEYPEIVISGNGIGARFIPSFACLDPDARVKVGSAKVGTGSYIDCP